MCICTYDIMYHNIILQYIYIYIYTYYDYYSNYYNIIGPATLYVAALGKGQMGSALMGSLKTGKGTNV